MGRMNVLLIIVLFLMSSRTFAQEISISATVDRNVVGLDDQMVLQVEISGSSYSIPEPNLPNLSDFRVYSSGRSQNISIINGRVSSSIIFSYTLAPLRKGKFTIGPVSITHQGKTYQTLPFEVEVTSPSAAPPPAQIPAAPPQPSFSPAIIPTPAERGNEVFIRTTVDKKEAYVGEQVTLTFAFYRSVPLLSNPDYRLPELSGFLSEDLPPQREYMTVIDGRRYQVTEIKTALFPLQVGKCFIRSATLTCRVEDFSPGSWLDDDFFRNFFSQGREKVLRTEPIVVKTKALPGGRPSDFTGAVGSFRLSAELDSREVPRNKPVTLTLRLEGKGNLKTVGAPRLPDLPDFKKYDTIESVNISKQNYMVSGSKTWQTILIPQKEKELSLPPITVSYFDPERGDFVKLSTQALRLSVTPGRDEEPPPAAGGGTAEQVRMLKKDIRYIKNLKDTLRDFSCPLYRSPAFLGFQGLPLLFLAAVTLYLREKEKAEKDPSAKRRSRAYALARSNIYKAGRFQRSPGEFYARISRSLIEYVGDKFSLPSAGITMNMLEETLEGASVSPQIRDRLMKLIERADMARFASTSADSQWVGHDLKEARFLLSALEKELSR